MTASARQRPPKRVPHLPKPRCRILHFAMAYLQRCGGQQPVLSLRKATRGRRPQRPGNQSRKRVFWKFPPTIHSRELPVTAGSAAIIWPSQELSRFAEHTLCQIVAHRNTKKAPRCAETVDDETSLWKTEEI